MPSTYLLVRVSDALVPDEQEVALSLEHYLLFEPTSCKRRADASFVELTYPREIAPWCSCRLETDGRARSYRYRGHRLSPENISLFEY